MGKGTFHQGFRRGMAVLFQQPLVQAAAVDTNADGDMPLLAHIHHSLHPILGTDVAGIDADLGRTALSGGNGQLVVKMDIRHQGQGAFLADLPESPGRLHIGHRQPCHLTTGGGQLPDLRKRALHIGGFGIEHGLDHHRRTAAHGNTANQNLSCHVVTP